MCSFFESPVLLSIFSIAKNGVHVYSLQILAQSSNTEAHLSNRHTLRKYISPLSL